MAEETFPHHRELVAFGEAYSPSSTVIIHAYDIMQMQAIRPICFDIVRLLVYHPDRYR